MKGIKMSDAEITMKDIRKALDLLQEEMPPNKTYKIPGGWVETDGFGKPISIGLDKEHHDLIKEAIKEMSRGSGRRVPLLEPDIIRIYGIEVVQHKYNEGEKNG